MKDNTQSKMRRDHPQICLYQPEIPQNTGAIGRLAAGAGCRLHLVKPLGFELSEREMRRAGLDYWPYLDLEIHEDFSTIEKLSEGKIALLTKFAEKPYTAIPTDTRFLIFGRETSGLPREFHQRFSQQLYRIPIFHEGVRSLNLANAVSVVVYDQLSQRGLFS